MIAEVSLDKDVLVLDAANHKSINNQGATNMVLPPNNVA
jgi:hypothetical protein